MKFTNMHLVGFKSFVESTDFEIRDGLTGIVGPNGCGKSNLLEALRWVMGATSAKALRGGAMADVIFAGTSMRPARNWAEVTLTLDNSDRTAPAEYNEETIIEVSRRIINKEDGAQSIYKINNKDARAKDVQLLFADASTGANSPALVRQGQISELINAKPQNRRRLLEEAAGISGLHTRRHEAELRLRAAETNLERLEDVTGELETQKTALARQARQATRYKNLSGDIRRTEAMSAYLRWSEAVSAQDAAKAQLDDIAQLIEETVRAAASASRVQSESHEQLDPLRQQEAQAAAALHRLTVSREQLDEEAARARAELERLITEIARLTADREREAALYHDAEQAVETLSREEQGLRNREASESERLRQAEQAMTQSADAQNAAEEKLQEQNRLHADFEARRRAAARALEETQRRVARGQEKIAAIEKELTAARASVEAHQELTQTQAQFAQVQRDVEEAENAYSRAEERHQEATDAEQALRIPLQETQKQFAEIKAESDALEKVLTANQQGDWPTLIEEIEVAPGYENALAAALGDDLGAALDESAPIAWSALGASPLTAGEAPLPDGIRPLTDYVTAPPALMRRLSAVGVVTAEQGGELRSHIGPGARLVSQRGDLWRWDGFMAHAEAKTAAAIRLEQRNRWTALQGDLHSAQQRLENAQRDAEQARENVQQAQSSARESRDLLGNQRRHLNETQSKLAQLERDAERNNSRLVSLEEQLTQLQDDQRENMGALETAQIDQQQLPNPEDVISTLTESRETANRARIAASEARAAHNDLAREANMRQERLEEIARERGVWTQRAQTATNRQEELTTRLEASQQARETAAGAPDAIEEKRRELLDLIDDAERKRNQAGDALAQAQEAANQADRTSKEADNAAAEAREARARFEAQFEAAKERVDEATALAHETCSAPPEKLLAISEHKEEKPLPARADIDKKLERYKRERENLGGVNLRAEEEMNEISDRLEEMMTEREDCEAAIRKLRAAIGGLNKEARQRLNDAFETVNRNFTSLFTRLFNGGQAELRLIESEDVLEAGLEIFASPPGKKLASMSLMSGGEQALTATALIFAVFMANPAPVCVLDEVDAPLDDANTERFCRMLHEMAQETQTRFIIITHHALTMSRMDRLFGVTMIERGVSQLVSVDLKRAAQMAAE